MQNVSVQRKRNPGDTDKNGIISEYREILREAGCLSFLRIHVCISEFRNIADWQQICLVHRKRCTGMKRGGKLLKKLEESRKVSANLRENEKYLRSRLENCSDILIRPMRLGDKHKVDCLMVYIEVAVSNMMLDDSALGKMINHFWEISPEDIQEFVRHNSLGIADVKKLENLDESIDAMLAGNAVFFIDGYDKAMKISSKGYPSTGVMEAESEKVLRGSREGFSDSVKSNSALVRKRLRDTRLKVEEYKIGVRSHTLTQVLYMDDLVHEGLLEEVKERLEEFQIDGILDSGMLEQLTEDVWYSPFPQYQTTERPDRAVQEILKGKVVILCDNSPEALILPGNFSSFMESSEDWYHRFEMASFLRILRYLAVIMATVLPGLYLAVIRFHTQILPSALILSFAEAREGVPFSSVVELIFLELAFELIREAGVRVPGSLGNAIGIVGGLVIGQAAVEANLVSPIVVMIVALTALGSMTVPNEEFAAAFRLVKYGFLILGGYLGIYGIVLGIYLVIGHLAGLISFGIPYLVPFIKKEQKGSRGEGVLRVPLRKRVLRPLYAREEQKIRLKRKESGS
jgi:spore germination protein